MKTVDIYTDGACSGNPGVGGYGIVLKYGDVIREISQGYKLTTNNRMELLGVIIALEHLREDCNVNLYSDSKYVVDAINLGWAKKWKENNWMRNKKEKALNTDLWERLFVLLQKHNVTFIWVKGHADNEYNNRCDRLAVASMKEDNLLDDEKYLK